ncbi:MAG: hypothetical protein ABRQ26_09830 [Syntrophomonadaceae bacterium]
MPINKRRESPSEAAAKGKFGKSYANELFAQVNDLFYEFGLIGRPKPKDDSRQDK